MTKKQKDEAFIEKIKTLGINTGSAESHPEPTCPACGGTADHIVGAIGAVHRVRKSGHDHSQEEAFAA